MRDGSSAAWMSTNGFANNKRFNASTQMSNVAMVPADDVRMLWRCDFIMRRLLSNARKDESCLRPPPEGACYAEYTGITPGDTATAKPEFLINTHIFTPLRNRTVYFRVSK